MTDQTCKHFSGTASLFPPQAVILLSYLSFLSPGILSAALSDYDEILQKQARDIREIQAKLAEQTDIIAQVNNQEENIKNINNFLKNDNKYRKVI